MKPQRIENPNGLQKFYESLHRAEQQWPDAFTRIIHYGDPHVAADWLTGKLRRNFHRDFAPEFIMYEAKGVNGARATKPLGWNWEAIAEKFTEQQPALLVIAYGTNEAGDADLDLAAYQSNFAQLLRHFKDAAPEASLLVIAPPDRAILRQGKWRTIPILPALIATQRAAALTEGGCVLESICCYGWHRFCQSVGQPDAQTCGQRKGWKVFGLLDYLSGRLFHQGLEGRLNSASYTAFLQQVLDQTKEPLCLIQDGGRYHTSAATKAFFAKHVARLTVYQLPSYSPDYNPIEKLWKKIKQEETHLVYFPTFDALRDKVEAALIKFARRAPEILSLCGLPHELARAA